MLAPARLEASPKVTATVLVKAPTPWLVPKFSTALLAAPLVRLAMFAKVKLALVEAPIAWRLTLNPLLLVTPTFAVSALPKPTITLLKATLLLESAPAAWL